MSIHDHLLLSLLFRLFRKVLTLEPTNSRCFSTYRNFLKQYTEQLPELKEKAQQLIAANANLESVQKAKMNYSSNLYYALHLTCM
jgi:hypothetical protein